MGKYSEFERVAQDFYPTPMAATKPLFSHMLDPETPTEFIEPFAGDGKLINNIETLTKGRYRCIMASDIEPRDPELDKYIVRMDYKEAIPRIDELCKEDNRRVIISNPPWINISASGYQLNDIIIRLSDITTTYLLLDGNYAFNLKSMPCMERCEAILPIGRVKWIEDSPYSGKENVAWFEFGNKPAPTRFYTRR